MDNNFSWPMIRFFKRFSMLLTLASCAYVAFIMFSKDKESSLPVVGSTGEASTIGLITPLSAPQVRPYEQAGASAGRDLFSMASPESTSTESTPKGQLPDHLKVVGIVVSHPSQIIIEDSLTNQTYFVDEGSSQDGIKIVKVESDQMIINYQGQDITVPITKN